MKRALNLTLLLVLCLTANFQAQTNFPVLLHTGTTTFPENVKGYSAIPAASETVEGNCYRLLQFYKLPSQADFDALAQHGISLLDYIPHNTYVASVPAAFDPAKFGQLGVRSIQPVAPALKQSPSMAALPEWAVEKGRALLMLSFFKNIPHESALRWCAEAGIEVLKSNGQNNFLLVSLPLEKADEIASLPWVAFVEPAPAPSVPDDVLGRSLHRANALDSQFPGGRHYTGEGVSVLVRDNSPLHHIDFEGRLNEDFFGETELFDSDHADGVAGILAGAGNLDPKNRGMAAGAFVYNMDYEPEFLDSTLHLHQSSSVLVTNSSFSNGCNAGYTEITATVDQQLWQNPTFLHVFSAGNANGLNECGYGAGNQWGNITGGHKQAKNAIATANLYADATIAGSSSRGPAHDGRIKPDIAANGAKHVSTDEGNTYQSFGGTSGAAPGIAGITAQLHQAYRELHNGETAEAALLKAVLLNTANDLGNPGPDFIFGWGHVNAYRAALTLEEQHHLKDTVEQGLSNTHVVSIPAGVRQARIMVYWADREATPFTSKALVNDLDAWVQTPTFELYTPWLLDHSPTPSALASPAAHGADHLNNMEQIALDNPAAGDYTLTVQGAELPFGAHPYFVVWEFRTDDITVTHPLGGEGFEPGDTVRIHWDAEGEAGNFTVSLSTDGGGTYAPLGTAQASERWMNWTVGAPVTGKAKIKVARGTFSDESDEVFSIAPRPQNVAVEKACPGYIRFKWDPAVLLPAGSVSYEVYALADKYMTLLDTVAETFFDLPTTNQNPYLDYWFAVRALDEIEGVRSERTVAVLYNGGLFECPQPNDLALLSIVSPGGGSFFNCAPAVTVTLQNAGTLPQPAAQVAYALDGGAPVVEAIPDTLAPGEVLVHTFAQPLSAALQGNHALKAYTLLPGDEMAFNDEDSTSFSLTSYPGTAEPLDYAEDFEGGTFPPPYYLLNNYDSSVTWTSAAVVGSDGGFTTAATIDNYSYVTNGELDEILTVPVDLGGAQSPLLTFDVAYAPFSADYNDGLRVEISADCGASFSAVLYEKFGAELATTPNQNSPFEPNAAGDWRGEAISLASWTGSSVVLKFTNINDYGNYLYLDNINVLDLSPPSVLVTASADTICQGESVTFTATTTGENLSFLWNFGAGASPATSTSAGPMTVTFGGYGSFTPSLTISNAAGQASASASLQVNPLPVAAFSWVNDLGAVTFTNLSQFAGSYFWLFGDGQGGTADNPVHDYAASGTYSVELMANSAIGCGSAVYTENISVSLTAASDLERRLRTFVSPNPTSGSFDLTVASDRAERLDVALLDAQGRTVLEKTMQAGTVATTLRFDGGELASGIWFLKIRGEDGVMAMKVVVE